MPSKTPKTTSWTVISALLAAWPSLFSSDTLSRPQQAAFGADVAVETISVAVADAAGEPISGLTVNDFVVTEDGEPRELAYVEPAAGAPLDIALVLDLSGSMGSSSWRDRTLAFIDALSSAQDCVLLLRFSRSVDASVWGRPGDAALRDAIEGSFTGGATSLYDALVEGVHRLAPFAADVGLSTGPIVGRTPGGSGGDCPAARTTSSAGAEVHRRTAIVAITDGVDSSSGHSMHQVELVTHAAGVQVFQIELAAGGRSAVTMRRTAPRRENPDRAFAVGQQRRGSFGDSNQPLVEFQRLVSASGGDTFRAGPEAYTELLERMRGSYIVGYRPSMAAGHGANEYTRHSVSVSLAGRQATVLHRPDVYRPSFDRARAEAELEAGIRGLEDQDLTASLTAFDRAIEAHPGFAAPHAWSAQVRLWQGEPDGALASAQRAVELDPANPEYQLLASDMASAVGRSDLAWDHAIRAAQAGAATEYEFRSLSAVQPPPQDIDVRLAAPRLAVLAAPATQADLIVRAALPTAMRGMARALSEHPGAALVADPQRAELFVWLLDKELSGNPPRRFSCRLMVTDPDGRVLFDEELRFADLDDHARNAEELTERIDEILDEVGGRAAGGRR